MSNSNIMKANSQMTHAVKVIKHCSGLYYNFVMPRKCKCSSWLKAFRTVRNDSSVCIQGVVIHPCISYLWDIKYIQLFTSLLQKMLFRPCRTLSSIRDFKAFPTISIFSPVQSNYILIKSPSSFPRLCESSLSKDACNISLVSVLQHPEYEGMKRKLEVEAHSALDLACLHILMR